MSETATRTARSILAALVNGSIDGLGSLFGSALRFGVSRHMDDRYREPGNPRGVRRGPMKHDRRDRGHNDLGIARGR